MADKLMIVMNTDPARPDQSAAPLFQATVAAAMEYEVEVILTGYAGELARRGAAEKLTVRIGTPRTVYDLIQEAHRAGVSLKVCAPTLEDWDGELIPEIDETVGSAYVISEAMDDDTVTFTY